VSIVIDSRWQHRWYRRSVFLQEINYLRRRCYAYFENTTGVCECRPDQNGETPAAAAAAGTGTAAAAAAAAGSGGGGGGTEKRDESRSEVQQINIGKEAAMEAEVKAARERAIIPLEIRMKQFRDMLAEKEVTTS